MTKFKCPACGEIILEKLTGCPHCGYPLEYAFKNDSCESEDNTEEEYLSEKDEVERQIRKFNWGAFLLAPYWGFANGMPWLFLIYLANGLIATLTVLICYYIFLPVAAISSVISIALSIYLGIAGSRLSWNKKRWDSISHFASVQKLWAIWGIAILIICFILLLLHSFLMYHFVFPYYV